MPTHARKMLHCSNFHRTRTFLPNKSVQPAAPKINTNDGAVGKGQFMTFHDASFHSSPCCFGENLQSKYAHAAQAAPSTRRVSLALQGGGALGAFTWGVLDRLLEENTSFDAVSGASAGAMNAAVLASGLACGGVDEARASLERFWRKVSEAGSRSRMLLSNPLLTAVTSQL